MSELFDFSFKRKNKLSILIDNCISVLKAFNKSKEQKELDNYYDKEYINFEIDRLKKLTKVTNLVEIKKMKEFQDFCSASGFFEEEIKAYNSVLRNQYGFSLIELILVLGIGSSITFLSFQQMLRKQEKTLAKSAGEQIKQIGNSVNSYIAVHYDKLSTLQNSNGTTLDPGPRNCITTNSTCSISIQTLINEGLLPLSYADKNIFNSKYTILLKKSGSAPYYNVTGLITTDNAWNGAGNSIRYDLLGQAMQEAGIDSGMTRENSNVLNGYKGLWNHNTTEFSNINKLGQLGYQAGYGSYSYSIYLRRDGTLPMTGNLNMGAQSINNVKDITASGVVQSATIKSTGSTTVGTTLNVSGLTTMANANVNGVLNANNNFVTAGTTNLKGATTLNSTLNVAGTTTLAGTNVNGQLNANSNLVISGTSNLKGATTLNSTLNVAGTSTLSTATINGVLTVNNAINATGNITSNGQLKGSTVVSNGRTTVGEFLQLNGTVTNGASCSPNGLQGRDSSGALLSCVNSKWNKGGGSTVITGLISNGQQIPLPGGFAQNQCQWSVSNSENPHGWKPNYFAGQVATANANRIVKCGYYDEYNFFPGTNRADLSGKCSYIVTCN
jgi:competence protein ComGC